MAILDIFSKRRKRLRGHEPDIYSYDHLPQPLKIQIIHIWRETLGDTYDYQGKVSSAYKFIVQTLCREYGVFQLPGSERHYGDRDWIRELAEFLLNEKDVEKTLDAIELSFRAIDGFTRNFDYMHRQRASEQADAAISELNHRFKEHGIGYQFAGGEIIRVDSELIHAEVVKPALHLLSQRQYKGVQEEFLKAHEHYRHGNAKEALNECLKSFESMMKAVCDNRGWAYSGDATAKNLIKACMDNGLVPVFWQQNFNALQSLLESSVPTGRNKLGGHGQGSASVAVPDYLVAYMLHMTAAAIVFLAEADLDKK